MFFLKAAFCRAFQAAFRLALPLLPYREPEIIHSCAQLDKVFEKENIRSVLIVTDKGIVNNGIVQPIERVLKNCGIAYSIYDKTLPNPTVRNVEEALAAYHKHSCSALIAIGGGSAIDCAKAVGARVVYPRKTVNQLGGMLKVHRKLPTLIAVPTTAGTGSETTVAALITDTVTHHKYALMSFPLIPHYAVLDATLTYTLPPRITSTTGVDALSHAVEAYIGRSTTKETRALALEATKLIFENVETAYSDGHNHAARKNMLHAAHKAGIAFSKSYVGNIHAIAHTLGGQYGTPHGLANAVIMPYVLEAYGTCIHRKLHRLAVAAGISQENETPDTAAAKFIDAIRRLNANMDIPDKISGIRAEDIPEMAKRAEKESNPLYPVPKLMTKKDLEAFYHQIADWSDK